MISFPSLLKNSQSFSPGFSDKQQNNKNYENTKKHKINNQQKIQDSYVPAYIKHRQQKNIINLSKKKITHQEQYEQLSKQERDIVTQIRDINIVIQNQKNKNFKTAFYGNFIFLKEVDNLVIDKFYECLKIQSQASNAIVQGFNFSSAKLNEEGSAQLVKRSIINSVKPIAKKLLQKSIANIYVYDNNKKHEFQNQYGKQWSIAKHHTENQENLQNQLVQQKYHDRSVVKRRTASDKNASRSTRLFQSKLSQFKKKSQINQSSFLNRLINSKITRNTNQNTNKNTRTKTQPIQQQEYNFHVSLTKKDVKSIILKNKKNMVSVWLPPSSYPQFFALFTYKIVKKQNENIYKCRILRYFFYKYNLNLQVFHSIFEWASQQTGNYIQILQLTIQKQLFAKQFSKQGWTMKYWESANKVRIQLNRKIIV